MGRKVVRVQRCTDCGERRPFGDFHKSPRNKTTGRQPYCKACHAVRSKAWASSNPEAAKQHAKKYRGTTEYHGLDAKRKREVRRGDGAEDRRRRRTLARYGMTAECYRELLEAQGGGCALCGATSADGKTYATTTEPRPLNVDHDHATGEVRGLLCSACNMALGLLKDDSARLLRAVDYLVGTARIGSALLSGNTEHAYEHEVVSSLERNTEWEPLT